MMLRFSKCREDFRLQSGSQTQKTAQMWILLHPLWESYHCTRYRLYHICHLKLMLDIPSPGSFQNIGLLIWAQQSSEHVKPCGTNWVKIKGAQLKINLHHLAVHWMLIKNCKRTMMIRCILTELLECKVHEKCLCLLMSALLRTWSCNNLVRNHQITMVFWQYLISIQCTTGLCDLIFHSDSSIFI